MTWLYASECAHVTGIDMDLDALRVARVNQPSALHAKAIFTSANARNLPFPREKFDLAVLAWSL